MKASVDAELCTGCGVCTETCPDVFQMGEDDEVAAVAVDIVPAELEESCQEAADDCPVEAISIEE